MAREVFRRQQVIEIIHSILQDPDTLLDAVHNENTHHTAETLFEDNEGAIDENIEERKRNPQWHLNEKV